MLGLNPGQVKTAQPWGGCGRSLEIAELSKTIHETKVVSGDSRIVLIKVKEARNQSEASSGCSNLRSRRDQMFIERGTPKKSEAPEERNTSLRLKVTLAPELRRDFPDVSYKHLAALGQDDLVTG